MEYVAKVANIVSDIKNDNFKLNIPPGGLDFRFGGTAVSMG